MSFAKDIAKFNKKTMGNMEQVFRGTALDLYGRLVRRTPVDEGTARGNWQVQINTPPGGTLNVKDPSGGTTISTGNGEIGKAKLGDSIFLINNLDYIQALEDGHSDQRPSGFVKITVAEYQSIVKRNTKR